MKTTLEFVKNVRASFHFAQQDIDHLTREHQLLKRRLELLEDSHRRIIHTFSNAPVTSLIGDLEKGELHREDCLLVASINDFNKMLFTNKLEARQRGFKECVCLS